MPRLRLPVLLKLASLFALTALLPAQLEEDSPSPASLTYFQLQVNQSVRPGETVPVQLTGMGFKQLQFRLYRVHDPVSYTHLGPFNSSAAPSATTPASASHPAV